jgi:hypothetical protein
VNQLAAELVQAAEARKNADEAVRVAAEHPAVQRWMKAGPIARAVGVGYDFAGVFSAWFCLAKKDLLVHQVVSITSVLPRTRIPPCGSMKRTTVPRLLNGTKQKARRIQR